MSKDVTWVDSTPGHQFIGNTLDNQLLTGEDFVRNDGKIFLSIDKKHVMKLEDSSEENEL